MARNLRAAAALAFLLSVVANAAEQEAYPTRPVRIMASNVGTTSDLLSRQIGQRLSEMWGRPVIVENRAAVISGAVIRAVIAATPDGYTFATGETNNLAVIVGMYENPPFDPFRDLAPVSLVARAPLVYLTHPSLPVSNLIELIAYAKQRPGKLSFGSSAIGGTGHVTHALFTQLTGVNILHVPYKGAPAAMLALMSGEVHLSTAATSTAMGQIKSGKVKALAVTSAKRSSALPDVPTAMESGLPGFDVDVWFALVAPARTPQTIVAKVNRDVHSVLNTPAIYDRILALGAEPAPSTPQELVSLMRSEVTRWSRVIKTAGIKID